MASASGARSGLGRIRSPQNLISGLVLILATSFALWALGYLPQGTLRSVGPAMLPRAVAVLIGLGGLALIVRAFTTEGEPLESWAARGPIFVTAGLIVFALTIRSPGFLVAAPLTVLISGLASREVRPKELAVMALLMTAICGIVFRYFLNQPIPMLVVPYTELRF